MKKWNLFFFDKEKMESFFFFDKEKMESYTMINTRVHLETTYSHSIY